MICIQIITSAAGVHGYVREFHGHPDGQIIPAVLIGVALHKNASGITVLVVTSAMMGAEEVKKRDLKYKSLI